MPFNSYSYEIVTNNFIEYNYTEIYNYCWLLLITGLNLKSKSFTTYRVTLYDYYNDYYYYNYKYDYYYYAYDFNYYYDYYDCDYYTITIIIMTMTTTTLA